MHHESEYDSTMEDNEMKIWTAWQIMQPLNLQEITNLEKKETLLNQRRDSQIK